MEKVSTDIFKVWQEEGRELIPENFKVFRNLVLQARDFADQGNYNMAAIYGDIAADYAAFSRSCGLFFSPELEDLLLTIGQKAIGGKSSGQRTSNPGVPKNVLHVVFGLWDIGGHSKLLRRWIEQDTERSHSVALTRMSVGDVPQVTKDAVFRSHGKIYALNETIGNFILRAKRLRKIAESADVVVLHTLKDSVIPVIAFADREQSPPAIYVNHADERFWTGVSITDVLVNLRESGRHLSQERRGDIEARRNMLLPTVLEPTHRTLSRTDAKRQLGIDEHSIVLLSIARGVKFKTFNGTTFLDLHLPLLKLHEQAILIVVGPGDREDWSTAIEQAQGRIRVFGETPDTTVFYQAADIYVDSYPFVSITSLLEAGSYGTPLVSCYPYSSDACGIFGADMPGLAGNLIRVGDLAEYTTVLSRLVEDEKFRLSLGEKTRKQIEEIHTGNNWQHLLEDIYSNAINLPRITLTSGQKDQVYTGEPDAFLEKVFDFNNLSLDQMILDRVRLMPLGTRLSFWLKLIKMGNFGRMGLISLFFPDWLYRRFGGPMKQ